MNQGCALICAMVRRCAGSATSSRRSRSWHGVEIGMSGGAAHFAAKIRGVS